MHRVTAKFVLHLMTDYQKANRVLYLISHYILHMNTAMENKTPRITLKKNNLKKHQLDND